ncbi:hypothetical protein K2X05_03990 [bacterium]|nr:hypothetical protein [bacterium]
MKKDVLKISTNSEFGDVWSLQFPQEISVKLEEPLKKSMPSEMIGFMVPDVWTVVLVLNSVPGLKEWVTNKLYDVTFDFLKSTVKTYKTLPPKISLTVSCPQSNETINVGIEGTESAIASIQVDIKTKYADGSKKKTVIKVKT